MFYLQIYGTGFKYPIYENNKRVIPIKEFYTKKGFPPKFYLSESLTCLYQSKDRYPLEEIKLKYETLKKQYKVKHAGWIHLTRTNYYKLGNVFDLAIDLEPIFNIENTIPLIKYINYLQSSPKDISKIWEYIEFAKTQWGLEQSEILSLTLSYLQQ
jgi:hypothetical protein